ncbi:MAG: F0F1 ATP synthase subunit delta [Opitutaceae bacterium]|nr:F0F1 ATP synthase subunit delta [Opitutaceae bacterium]
MAAQHKQVQQLARQLFAMSLAEGSLSAERVAGVLEYLEKHPPAQPMAVLLAYRRLVAVEFAKGRAVVEHAGPLGQGVLASIESAMARRYGRPILAVAKDSPGLLAGVRVRVGDDVYESSVASQLAGLSV